MKLTEAFSKIQETQAFQGIRIKKVNEPNLAGNTPLHIAVCLGDLELISTLINEGADINAIGEFGGTALHFAAEEWHLEVIEYLIKNGAVARPDAHGDWPSTRAGNHTKIVALLKSIEK